MRQTLLLTCLSALALCAGQARADDWVADKLRGQVLVFTQGAWVQLNRGDVVAGSSVIRTGPNGSVRFTRDRETIDLEAETQIQIFDRKGQRYTTVRQFFGAVGVEANVENVKHFEVRTPYLAAVVKGTIFTVLTTGTGSMVETARGKVGVNGQGGQHSDVPAGQMAAASPAHGMGVADNVGAGAAPSAPPRHKGSVEAFADVLAGIPKHGGPKLGNDWLDAVQTTAAIMAAAPQNAKGSSPASNAGFGPNAGSGSGSGSGSDAGAAAGAGAGVGTSPASAPAAAVTATAAPASGAGTAAPASGAGTGWSGGDHDHFEHHEHFH